LSGPGPPTEETGDRRRDELQSFHTVLRWELQNAPDVGVKWGFASCDGDKDKFSKGTPASSRKGLGATLKNSSCL